MDLFIGTNNVPDLIPMGSHLLHVVTSALDTSPCLYELGHELENFGFPKLSDKLLSSVRVLEDFPVGL